MGLREISENGNKSKWKRIQKLEPKIYYILIPLVKGDNPKVSLDLAKILLHMKVVN
jgi:hypothetical protein